MADYTDILKDLSKPVLLERTSNNYDEASIEIDEDGAVSLSVDNHLNGDKSMPMDEWNGRTISITLASAYNASRVLDIDRLRDDLAEGGTLATLIDRVVAGHTVEWDGSNNTGHLTEDAREALEDTTEPLDYTADIAVWAAEDWIQGQETDARALANLNLTTAATPAEIKTAADDCESAADADGVVLTGNCEDAINNLIARVKDEEEEFKLVKKKEEAKKPYHVALAERLIVELQKGTAPWQKPWSPGTLPMNPNTDKSYRGINRIALMLENRTDPRWMTYKQAKAAGAQVKHGEHGTRIEYWKFTDKQTKRDEHGRPVLDKNGQPVQEEVQLERPRIFFATVFNAEQIDGLPPLKKREITWNPEARAEQILTNSGATIIHGEYNNSYYAPQDDSIHLPGRSQFADAESYYSTALHELSHWTGHKDRLNRDIENPYGSEGYAKEELRAEIASMSICGELGIGHNVANHASYVGSWIKALKDNPLEIFRAAADAEKIQTYVFGLEQEQTQTQIAAEKKPVDELNPLQTAVQNDAPGLFMGTPEQQLERLKTALIESIRNDDDAENDLEYLRQSGQDKNNALYDVLSDSRWNAEREKKVAEVQKMTLEEAYKKYPDEFKTARTYLKVPYREKDQAKALGALWDRQEGAWYVAPGKDVKPFAKWVTTLVPAETLKKTESSELLLGFPKIGSGQPLGEVVPNEDLEVRRYFASRGNESLELYQRFSDQELALEKELKEKLEALPEAAHGRPLDDDAKKHMTAEFTRQCEVTGLVLMSPPVLDGKPHKVKTMGGGEGVYQGEFTTDENGKAVLQGEIVNSTANKKYDFIPGYSAMSREEQALYREYDSKAYALEKDFNNRQERLDTTENKKSDSALLDTTENKKRDRALLGAPSIGYGHELGADIPENKALYASMDKAQADLYRTCDRDTLKLEKELKEKLDALPPEKRGRDLDSLVKTHMATEFMRQCEVAGLELTIPPFIDDRPHSVEIAGGEKGYYQGKFTTDKNGKAVLQGEIVNSTANRKDVFVPGYSAMSREEQALYREYDSKAYALEKELYAKLDALEKNSKTVQPRPITATGTEELDQLWQKQKETVLTGRTYIAVPYGERDAAKAAGAHWDKKAKSWYVGKDADLSKVARWIPKPDEAQQDPAKTVKEEFADALRQLNCAHPDDPFMDGRGHRVKAIGDKKSERSIFYVVHTDDPPAGYIKNNRTGVEIRWKAKGYSLTDEEKASLRAEAAQKSAERDAAELKMHEATAERVEKQLATLQPVQSSTPYLSNKGISAKAGAFTDAKGKDTFLPAYDVDGRLWSMQYVLEDGTKRFAKDSRKTGCFNVVGGGVEKLANSPVLIIAEGYATASTLSDATGQPTVAAFDAGNLKPVAVALHEKFPAKPIVIAGDNDRHLEFSQGVNQGKTKAQKAAAAVHGVAVFPVFAPGETSFPDTVPKITPETFKRHQAASDALLQKGLSEERKTSLQADLLSPRQLEVLDSIKKRSDFNDLAQNSSLGMKGVERQIQSVLKKINDQQVKNQAKAEKTVAQNRSQKQEDKEQRHYHHSM